MYSNSKLAAYATFKTLYKSEKYHSLYQILSEYIRFVIVKNKLRDFTLIELQNCIETEFGIKPMISVLMRSISEISGITIYQQGKGYKADLKRIKQTSDFALITNEAKTASEQITNRLIEYTKANDVSYDERKIADSFMAYVLDEHDDTQYSSFLSQFIIENTKDSDFTETLDTIREGSVLYTGLACNLDSTEEFNEPLTLYLDTEVIFDLMGLNGILFKSIADDLVSLVKKANSRKEKVIDLRYFREVKKDLDSYFLSAERIVQNGEIVLDDAMKEIVTDCTDISDVAEKKVKFFRKLHHEFGIREDEKEDYNTDDDVNFSLEEDIPQYPIGDQANYEAILFSSKISKLRRGLQTLNYLKCQHLCVTRTNRVLEVSSYFEKKQKNGDIPYCGYAIGLNHITNILWLNLNQGIGATDFPRNIDVVIKAKLVLSGFLTQSVAKTFDEAKEKRDKNLLTDDDVLHVAVELRKRHTKPEDINSENVREQLALTQIGADRIAEERANDKRIIKEKEDEIEKLAVEVRELNHKIEAANYKDQQNTRLINELSTWKNSVEQKENNKKANKLTVLAWIKVIWSFAWRIIITVAAIVLLRIITGNDYLGWLGIAISILGLIWKRNMVFGPILSEFENDKKRIKGLRGDQ